MVMVALEMGNVRSMQAAWGIELAWKRTWF